MADNALRGRIAALTRPNRRCERPGCDAPADGFHHAGAAAGWEDACGEHLGVIIVGGEERPATDVYRFPGEPQP